jgi:hypothetical protein
MRFLVLLFVLLLSLETIGAVGAQPASDPDAVREARGLLERAGIDELDRQHMTAVSTQLMSTVQSIDAGKDKDKLMAEFARLAGKQIEARLPKYAEEVALIYARTFTLDELKQLNAFYDSPLGQKLLGKTPLLFKESADLTQQMGADVVREVWRVMLPELQKRGIKTAPN